jgi:hypothetical protein
VWNGAIDSVVCVIARGGNSQDVRVVLRIVSERCALSDLLRTAGLEQAVKANAGSLLAAAVTCRREMRASCACKRPDFTSVRTAVRKAHRAVLPHRSKYLFL